MRLLPFASLLLLAVPVLAGCPDPTTTTTDAGAAPAGGPEADPNAAGTPGAPVNPDGTAVAVPSGRPEIVGWKPEAGEGVKLSGKISYTGTKEGALRLDFLKPGANGAFPELLNSATVDKLGEWSVDAPKTTGEVGIVAYLDAAGDGPSPTDPAGRVKGLINIAAVDITGLDIELSDTPNLEDFAPGAGAGAPPANPPPNNADGAATTPGAQPGPGIAPDAAAKPPADAAGAPPAAGAVPAGAAAAPAAAPPK